MQISNLVILLFLNIALISLTPLTLVIRFNVLLYFNVILYFVSKSENLFSSKHMRSAAI